MHIAGTYPMMFAFFDAQNRLRRDAFTRQIEAALTHGASGVAVWGWALKWQNWTCSNAGLWWNG